MIDCIFKNLLENSEQRDVVYVSSINISAIMARIKKFSLSTYNDQTLLKAMGINTEQPFPVLIFIVIHCGHHWSLLVYWKERPKTMYHYDSLGLNARFAVDLVTVLSNFNPFNQCERMATPKFYKIQKSCWECGYYCIVTLVIYLHKMKKTGRIEHLREEDLTDYDLYRDQIFRMISRWWDRNEHDL